MPHLAKNWTSDKIRVIKERNIKCLIIVFTRFFAHFDERIEKEFSDCILFIHNVLQVLITGREIGYFMITCEQNRLDNAA